MLRDRILRGGLLAALALLAGCAAPPSADAPRIGTFDSRGVALAWGRSTQPDGMLTEVERIRTAHREAEAAGEAARATQLEAQAVALQDRVHEQVFGGGPIDELLARLEPEMAGIAAAAGVDLIVTGVLHRGAGVEVVDVTEAMCAPFAPDAETREHIAALLAAPPSPHAHEHE